MPGPTFRQAVPVLHVTSTSAAEHFFCQDLGFERTFVHRPDPARPDPAYLGVARGDALLHLSSFPGDGVGGSVVYLIVEDIDGLYEELILRGVSIDMAPTDQTWGNREMYVCDPDGNSIRFVREVR
ncbi:MAG TPA: VOC family protein [Vicinamibacterales bacterium]|nr:VOC family protein [Vicinamibacterales bacterium]